jgi:hypothetical protein
MTGNCNGVKCFAIEPASSATGYYVAASGTGDASGGLVAVSVFGNASGTVALSLKDDLCNVVVCVHPSWAVDRATVVAAEETLP